MVLLVLATIKYAPIVTELVSEPEEFRDLIQSYGYTGVFIFVLIQIIQIVIPVIPGEVVQVAGGFVFGTWLGTLYLMIGVILGSVCAFFAARLLGYPLVRSFVSENKLRRMRELMQGKKSDAVIFILFLLPGLPKDVLTYIAGLTPVKSVRFLVIASMARFPALLASAYLGHNLHEKDYLGAIIISSVAVLLFVGGYIFKDRIIGKMQEFTTEKQDER
ncbi:MAG: TVP38/TMEM64 family protein [Firmicutes bacterium]|nr:TVP38/TMEM64 family protein [Bacillota bacterium]